METPPGHNPPTFTLSRTFDAPLDLVWRVYTEEEHLAKWWGPKGLEWIKGEVDLRPGGLFYYGMRIPNGPIMWGKFIFREIVPKKLISFVVSFSDENKGVTRHPMSAKWPLEVFNTVIFSEEAGKTTLQMFGSPINASAEETAEFGNNFPSMEQGFKGTLDQLEDYLKTAE